MIIGKRKKNISDYTTPYHDINIPPTHKTKSKYSKIRIFLGLFFCIIPLWYIISYLVNSQVEAIEIIEALPIIGAIGICSIGLGVLGGKKDIIFSPSKALSLYKKPNTKKNKHHSTEKYQKNSKYEKQVLYEQYAATLPKKLYRSVLDRKILGVCGGLSTYFGINASLIRISLVILCFITSFIALPIYLIVGVFILDKNPHEMKILSAKKWNEKT